MSGTRLRHGGDPLGLAVLPEVGDVVAQRYRIMAELGRGGMCAVLSARDQMLDRDVALKVMLPRLMASEEMTERFTNEARILARMESRHIVRVLDFGVIERPVTSAGLPFMVLELLRGQDLFGYATEHGSLTPSRVVRLALEACDGLAAAHAEGIIHRDLKPENLFVALEPDGTECLKVLDFGIARGRSARVLTLEQMGVGSPGYMSPEQVTRSSEVDARSDIWSLGIVMYELLAHRPVFAGDDPQDLCRQIVEAPIAPLGKICPHLPPALVYVVERCLERDRERRFQDVAQLAEALSPLDDWSPVSEAKRIRRRLDSISIVPAPPVTPPPARDVEKTQPRSRKPRRASGTGRRRRVLSATAAVLTLAPFVALLPALSRAPELAPARAWSEDALVSTQAALYRARDAAKAFWIARVTERDAAVTQPAP